MAADVPNNSSKKARKQEDMGDAIESSIRTLYFGIDVEKLGRHHDDSLIAIGIAVADTKSGVIEAKRWCFPGPYVVEKLCMEEFWSKHSKLLTDLISEGSEANAGAQFQDIRRWLARYECQTARLGDTYNGRCSIGSDEPSFDLACVDAAWEKVEKNHEPLHYTRSGAWRNVWDSSERIEALGLDKKLITAFLESINVRNDHKPENDATKHVWELFITMAYSAFLRHNTVPSHTTWEAILTQEDAKRTVLYLASCQERHLQNPAK